MTRRIAPYFAALVALGVTTAASASGGFEIPWWTLDGGGGTVSGGAFQVSGTVGQPDAGARMTGGAFTVTGGFWAGVTAGATCSGDVDGNGTVDFDDVLRVLAAWGACPDCPEDLNDDDVVDFDDLLLVLSAWGPCA